MGRSTTSPAPNRGHTHSEVRRLTFVALATCKKGERCPDPGLMSLVHGWDTYSKYRNCTLLDHSIRRITRRCHSRCTRWNERTGGRIDLFLSAQQTPHQHS